MKNFYFRNVYGNTAAIIEKEDKSCRLIIKDRFKTTIKDQPYKNMRGAKTALGMAGPWIEVFPVKQQLA